ncbi:hypothetical protein [Ornithinimicrobium pratense]|uniref:hypothetical protein n=1 Tax=Ornithinimicrobium pratense TaxID=2593973 RepID=UPI0017886647|nr:hypothetical protein [Ornithinimicrobium pratense]
MSAQPPGNRLACADEVGAGLPVVERAGLDDALTAEDVAQEPARPSSLDPE